MDSFQLVLSGFMAPLLLCSLLQWTNYLSRANVAHVEKRIQVLKKPEGQQTFISKRKSNNAVLLL